MYRRWTEAGFLPVFPHWQASRNKNMERRGVGMGEAAATAMSRSTNRTYHPASGQLRERDSSAEEMTDC